MRKPFASLITVLLLLVVFGLIIGPAGNISANSESQEPANYYPDRVSLIEYGGYLSLASDQDAAEIVRDFSRENSEILGFAGADLSGAKVTDKYTSEANGVTHVYFQQLWEGLLVDDAFINGNVTEDGRILTLNSSFIADLEQKANDAQPGLSAVDAVESAAEYLGLEITEELDVLEARGGTDAGVLLSDGGISLELIPAKLMYDPVSANVVRLAWDITIYETSAEHWWSMRVDANDGRILSQNDFVAHDNWSVDTAPAPALDDAVMGAAVYRGEGAVLNGYKVYPMPIESPSHTSPAPPMDGRTNEVEPADSLASPYGWHDTDGAAGPEFTTTQGNNVHGYTDIDNNNLPDSGSSPDGGPSLGFDFPVDLTNSPSAYRPAAVTNLFYWNNINHDVYYHYGFDEAGGNFQENNYGRGGLGSDYVNAEAQDGSGSNNANFGTPPDGSNPRMQMFIWGAYTNPDVGSSFDNGVIVHEYGHGISNRLTGGPSQASCLANDEQMGEGWSDLSTLFLTALPSHTETTARGIGTYVLGQATTGLGIRNYRYSTDMLVNPQTYDDIRDTGDSEHDLGEIWAAMYWEVYWNLVYEYGFNADFFGDWTTGGNNLAMQLYIDGMKFQPCSPGFVDGRDAILAADVALTGGLNQCLIWEGFAKRGLGFSADQGSAGSRNDGTEVFDMPPACATIDTIPSPTTNDVCAGGSASYLVGVGVNFTAPITMDGSTDAPYGSVSFTPNPVVAALPALVDMEVSTTGSTLFGTYTVDFAGNDGGYSAFGSTTLNVFDAIPESLVLTAPENAAINVLNPPTFEWGVSAQAITYTLDVDDDPAFGSIDYSAVVEGTSHALPFNQPLEYLTTYYWRVTAGNICGDTASSVWEFTTVNEPGGCNTGFATVVAYETDLEDGAAGWTHSGTNDTWTLSDAQTTSGLNAWYADDLDTLSDQRLVSPPISLPALNYSTTLRFQSYQAFEEPDPEGCWDAAILEISIDDGTNWSKIPNSTLLTDPYDDYIWNFTPGNNPITYDYGATMAWCDPGQPFLNSVVSLDAYAGQEVRFRWRLGTDSAAGGEGWYIDDVKVQSCLSAPQVGFTSNSPVNVGNQSVFNNTTTGGGFIEYQWNFGDGTPIVTVTNTTHLYEIEDTYTVILTATNEAGSNVYMDQFVVLTSTPSAGFTSNSPIVVGSQSVFSNTTTGGGFIEYEWNFGDGTPIVTDTNPTHLYAVEDTYTVILTATNEGGSDIFSDQHVVQPSDPSAGFTSNSPVVIGSQSLFTNTTTGTGSIEYLWNFGDGSPISTDTNPSHIFAAVDSYTVILTATNDGGVDVISGLHEVVEVSEFDIYLPLLLNPVNMVIVRVPAREGGRQSCASESDQLVVLLNDLAGVVGLARPRIDDCSAGIADLSGLTFPWLLLLGTTFLFRTRRHN